ncbi:MAG: molybdopterin-dependent oxidoreductase [Acidilobaceae archaeon]|nr:molybdopterin-dependent oxidoreductase [Acidilobaceae archaeon]MDW7973652.1 molybdopterin-dependent oxidoreductase [Sulfolobales archaeon]
MVSLTRRDFVKLAGAFAGLALVGGAAYAARTQVQRMALAQKKEPLELQYVRTFCSMCGALCGIEVVLNGGKPIAVRAIDGQPQTGACGRGASLPWLYDNPLRLRKPLKRVGEKGEGKFVEVDWDTALNEIAAKLKAIVEKHGFKSIAITHHDIWSGYMGLFQYLFGTPNRVDHSGSCFGHGTVARRHTFGIEHHRFVDPDYDNANYVLAVGRTISTASMGVVNRVMRNENLRIVVVDPRAPEIAFTSAEWIPIIPGTDAAFLLSLIHIIISERLYDEEFLMRFTNAPFLIKPDGRPLVEADIREGGGTTVYLVMDAAATPPSLADHRRATRPLLLLPEERREVTLKDGSSVRVKTAFELLAERAAKYPPAEASKITGIPKDTIVRIAREFAAYRGVADDTWYAAKNGNEYDVVRALLILNALVGNIDRRGGLVFREDQGFPSFVTERTVEGRRVAETVYGARMPEAMFADRHAPRVDRVKYPENTSTFDVVFDAILKGDPYPIKALFLIGSSPMAREMKTSKVIEAYKNLELLVVIDVLPQDDVDYADYVLPDTIFLERDETTDIKWSLHAATHVQKKMLDPPPDVDARDALWIMFEIARRAFPERAYALGWKDEYADHKRYREEFMKSFEEAVKSRLASNWRMDVAVVRRELDEKGYIMFKPKEFGVRPYRTALPTPSGKVEIYSLRAVTVGMDPLPDQRPPLYTLPKAPNEFYLVNGKSPNVSVHAALMEPMKYLIERSVWMNPKDAERLGIKDGDLIELEGIDTGVKRRARVKVTERVREGVLFTYAQSAGRTSKLLPPDHFAREGINPHHLNDARPAPGTGGNTHNTSVRVRKVM